MIQWARRWYLLLMAPTADFDRWVAEQELRLRQWRCNANLRGVPTKGQGLYEFVKHPAHQPFSGLPIHIRLAWETTAAEGVFGIGFRGNNSAYRRHK